MDRRGFTRRYYIQNLRFIGNTAHALHRSVLLLSNATDKRLCGEMMLAYLVRLSSRLSAIYHVQIKQHEDGLACYCG